MSLTSRIRHQTKSDIQEPTRLLPSLPRTAGPPGPTSDADLHADPAAELLPTLSTLLTDGALALGPAATAAEARDSTPPLDPSQLLLVALLARVEQLRHDCCQLQIKESRLHMHMHMHSACTPHAHGT